MIPPQAVLWFWYVAGTVLGIGLPAIVLVVLMAAIVKLFQLEQQKQRERRKDIH